MPEEKKDIDQVIFEKLKKIFNWWVKLATISDDDPFWAVLIKVAFKLVGVLILIALSPFAILGLIIALLFVG